MKSSYAQFLIKNNLKQYIKLGSFKETKNGILITIDSKSMNSKKSVKEQKASENNGPVILA